MRYVVLHPWYADGDAICSGRRAGLWAVLAGDRWSLAIDRLEVGAAAAAVALQSRCTTME